MLQARAPKAKCVKADKKVCTNSISMGPVFYRCSTSNPANVCFLFHTGSQYLCLAC